MYYKIQRINTHSTVQLLCQAFAPKFESDNKTIHSSRSNTQTRLAKHTLFNIAIFNTL